MKNSIKLITILLFSILFFTQCNSGGKKEKLNEISIRLPIPVVDGAFAPFYVGQDKGIFEKYGLKVKIELGSSELNPIKMVSQGTNQIGVLGGPELLITGKEKGADIVGIALMHKNSDFVVIISKKDSKFQNIADLEGQEVGFFYGHISTDVIRGLLAKEKINVKEVDVGFNYNLFIADKLPAQWAFRTTAGLTLPSKGIELNYISPADYGIETHGHTIISSKKLINEKPELIQNFISALIEATTYSLNNVGESVASVKKRDTNLSEDIIAQQLEIYNQVIKQNTKTCWIEKTDLNSTMERLIEMNIISEPISLDSIINNSFLKEYYSEKISNE